MEQESLRSAKNGLKALAKEEVKPFHYESMMARVREDLTGENPIMKAAKRTAIASGVIVAIIISMVLIPASYSVNVGSIITAEFPVGKTISPMDVVEATNEIEGIFNTSMSIKNDQGVLTLALKERDADKVEKEVRTALAGLMDELSQIRVSSEKIKKLMGGNALAAVTGGQICIGIKDLSEVEIEAQIISSLSARGVQVRDVNVETREVGDGQREVKIRVEADRPEGEMDMEACDELEGLFAPEDGQFERRIIIKKECEEVEEE
ncbi:hypothetical protein H8D57_03855 [bacterium]|nr:hypothetical protein [bacterium]